LLELSNAKVFVTGGAGFIGSHLTDSLLKLGARVVVYDNFDDFYTGKEENLRQHLKNGKFKLIRGDVLDYDRVLAASKGADIIFHLAAQAGVRYSIGNPIKVNDVNVTGTLNVLRAAKEHDVKKFVYSSSSSVYGKPSKVPIDETHPTNPTNPYAVSKLAAEKYCLSYYATHGLPVTCLRYFSVYGPRGRPDQVIYSFAKSITEGVRPVIYGDGSQTRDFTYVSDVVSATLIAALREESVGHVMNIGYGRELRILDVATILLKRLGSNLEPEFRPAYKGDFPRTLCSNLKAKTLLGWNAQTSFDHGLTSFLEWFKAQQKVATVVGI
jgi:UDP-glucose 4-epimerase